MPRSRKSPVSAKEQRAAPAFHPDRGNPVRANEADCPYEVRHSAIHGDGVFAALLIKKDARVIEYVGEKITKRESERRGAIFMQRAKSGGHGAVYIFNLNKKHDLDGHFEWNLARLINHSCSPNCEAQIIRGRIWYVALRDIAQGEEITINYNFDMEDWEKHPCRCGAVRCVGYIIDENLWPELRRRKRMLKAGSRRRPAGG
jgi:SET domain-containing protein